MVLEYEKMYKGEPGCLSWILVAKKRYAGYKWDAWADSGKLVYTGLECKRRDFCRHTRETMKSFLLDLFTKGKKLALVGLRESIRNVIYSTDKEGFTLSKQYVSVLCVLRGEAFY